MRASGGSGYFLYLRAAIHQGADSVVKNQKEPADSSHLTLWFCVFVCVSDRGLYKRVCVCVCTSKHIQLFFSSRLDFRALRSKFSFRKDGEISWLLGEIFLSQSLVLCAGMNLAVSLFV